MSWFYLALLAPLLYAIVVLIDDNLLRTVYRTPAVGASISGLFAALPAAVLLLMGYGSLALPFNLVIVSVAAGLLMSLSYFFYFQGFEKASPSVVAVVLTLTPVVLPFVAYFVVNERLSSAALVGFAVIILAAFAYAAIDVKKMSIGKALWPVLVAALLIDGAALASKYVYDRADFYAAFIYFLGGMFLGGALFALVVRRAGFVEMFKGASRKVALKLFGLLALVEIINLTAELVHGRAVSLGSVSLVNVLENIQPLYVLLIAVLLFPFFPWQFREAGAGHVRVKLMLALVMVGGVYLVAR